MNINTFNTNGIPININIATHRNFQPANNVTSRRVNTIFQGDDKIELITEVRGNTVINKIVAMK